MDYSVHYLDVACMFATDGWQLANSRYELDYSGYTSLIEGRFNSPDYRIFVLVVVVVSVAWAYGTAFAHQYCG